MRRTSDMIKNFGVGYFAKACARVSKKDLPNIVNLTNTYLDCFTPAQYVKKYDDVMTLNPFGSQQKDNRCSGKYPKVLFDIPDRSLNNILVQNKAGGMSGKYLGIHGRIGDGKLHFPSTWEMYHYVGQPDNVLEVAKKHSIQNPYIPYDSKSDPYWAGKPNPALGLVNQYNCKYTIKQPLALFDLNSENSLEYFSKIQKDNDVARFCLENNIPDLFECLTVGGENRLPHQIMAHLLHALYPDVDGCIFPSFRADRDVPGAQNADVVTLWGEDSAWLGEKIKLDQLRYIGLGEEGKPKVVTNKFSPENNETTAEAFNGVKEALQSRVNIQLKPEK